MRWILVEATGARSGRHADQGASDRHRSPRRREMGQAHRRPDQGQGAGQGQPDARTSATWSMSIRLNKDANTWRLRQVPEISGAMVAMDPHTGRVLAMVGGFSYDQSQFNRATQAMRQPGSSFKPFVYAAALDNGYTPATVVMDAPIEIDQGPGSEMWRPENYRRQVRRPVDAALRHREVAQPDDGAAGPGHGHAADRRICRALRRLRQPAAYPAVCRSAPARPRCCAWSRPIR